MKLVLMSFMVLGSLVAGIANAGIDNIGVLGRDAVRGTTPNRVLGLHDAKSGEKFGVKEEVVGSSTFNELLFATSPGNCYDVDAYSTNDEGTWTSLDTELSLFTQVFCP